LYQPGDLVYLSTANLTFPPARVQKLLPKFIGPYKIIGARHESSSYDLELPDELRRRHIHPVVHVSRLRPYIPNDDVRFPGREARAFYDFGNDTNAEWVVLELIGHRHSHTGALEFLVKWELWDPSWEPATECLELEALTRYLELQGVSSVEELPQRGSPPQPMRP
jgi:hypothetical protein